MHRTLLLLAIAGIGSAAGASEPPTRPSGPAEPRPRLSWRPVLDGLPVAADPAPVDWRASNQTVYRLNGHIGHWRGALQLPPIDAAQTPGPADSGAERKR